MYIRKKVRKRSFFQSHRVLILSLIGMGACLTAFLVAQKIRSHSAQLAWNPPASAPAPQAHRSTQPVKKGRYIYPYSVIPGGVLSREELAKAISKDKVVAAHYAGFALNDVKVVKAEENQFMYVSYRVKDKVFWTSKKVKIPKGEPLITDGKETARTRCGNKVSAEVEQPVSEEEPAPETFETPLLARLEVPELDILPPPRLDYPDVPAFEPLPRMPLPEPEAGMSLPERKKYYPPHLPQDNVVPEPATWSLLAIGLTGLLAFRFARKK